MKTLLLTDIPPSSNLTAGIVTAQMCRLVPPGELAIFCVQNRHLQPAPFPDLASVPIRTVRKPNELGHHNQRLFPLDRIGAIAIETARRLIEVPPLVRQAIAYGREQSVTSLWVVLQGQTMVRMARAVAEGLRVPMRVQIWDPLGWWLRSHKVDRYNRTADLAEFDRVLRQAEGCATASWAMSQQYQQRYGTPCHTIIASLDPALARRPKPSLRTAEEFAIGMAGQFYAEEEWVALLRALNHASWKVAGRQVVLRVAGHPPPHLELAPPDRIGFLGWKPQPELIEILSRDCDVLYCPYPFASHMEEVARLSFPSKIPTYLAAGRPILFHGPKYASPAAYLADRQAGLGCQDLEPAAVYNGLLHLAEDAELYQQLALAGQAAFLRDFNLATMADRVRKFLGYSA
jgi:glycosyltransferase involved in cell wall biosynthesis